MLSSWKIQVLKVMKFFIWIICRWNLIFRGKIDSDYFICRVYIYLKFVKWICYNNVQNEIFLYNFRIEIFISMNVNFSMKKHYTMNQDFGKNVSTFCSNLSIILRTIIQNLKTMKFKYFSIAWIRIDESYTKRQRIKRIL